MSVLLIEAMYQCATESSRVDSRRSARVPGLPCLIAIVLHSLSTLTVAFCIYSVGLLLYMFARPASYDVDSSVWTARTLNECVVFIEIIVVLYSKVVHLCL